MREALGHHADYCVCLVVECDLLTNDRRIAAESLLPKPVADESHWGSTRLVVFVTEIAAQQRGSAHHLEISGTDHSRIEGFRLIGTCHVHCPAAERRYRFRDLIPI